MQKDILNCSVKDATRASASLRSANGCGYGRSPPLLRLRYNANAFRWTRVVLEDTTICTTVFCQTTSEKPGYGRGFIEGPTDSEADSAKHGRKDGTDLPQ